MKLIDTLKRMVANSDHSSHALRQIVEHTEVQSSLINNKMNELIEYQKAQTTLQRAHTEALVELAKAISALRQKT